MKILSQTLIQADIAAAATSFERRLLGHAYYKTNNKELSQDLVQSTFLKALLYLKKGGKIVTMRTFLNHILHDLIIDEYRKNKNISLDCLLESGFDPSADDRLRTENIFDGHKYLALIKDLPPKYQNIMDMRYVRDLSLTEIASLTRQNKNTTAVQLYRGLQKLKALELSSR